MKSMCKLVRISQIYRIKMTWIKEQRNNMSRNMNFYTQSISG